jgi:hypothetical protein
LFLPVVEMASLEGAGAGAGGGLSENCEAAPDHGGYFRFCWEYIRSAGLRTPACGARVTSTNYGGPGKKSPDYRLTVLIRLL